MPPSPLEELPFETLKHVLLFLGDTTDLLHVEQTCTKLRTVVADDQVWSSCLSDFKHDLRLQTNRDKACVSSNIRQIRKIQKCGDNLLLRVFGEDETACHFWKSIVHAVLNTYLPNRLVVHQLYVLRGDTMHILLELLQMFLTEAFSRASRVAVETCGDDAYPTLKVSHLQLQEALGQRHGLTCEFFKNYTEHEMLVAKSFLDEHMRDKITLGILGTAFRGGVSKLDKHAHALAWMALVHFIASVFQPACESLVGMASPNQPADAKRQLSLPFESMFSLPPYSIVLDMCYGCGELICLHTPVPSQLKEAASKLLPTFPTNVYNDCGRPSPSHWLCYDDTCENEIAAAEAKYEIVEDGEDHDEEADVGEGEGCKPGQKKRRIQIDSDEENETESETSSSE